VEELTTISARAERRSRVYKAMLAIFIADLLLYLTLPGVMQYIKRAEPIDYGDRALVVFSIPPNTGASGLVARWDAEKNKETGLDIFLTSNSDVPLDVPVSVTLVESHAVIGDLKCDAHQADFVAIPQLDLGTKNAATADSTSGKYGTQAVQGLDLNRGKVNSQSVVLTTRKWFADDVRDFSSSSRCTIPSSIVWRDAGPEASALLPEIDLVMTDWSALPSGEQFFVDAYLRRTPGTILSESYPALNGQGSSYTGEIQGFAGSRLFFTAQPTAIVSERSTTKSDTILLALSGVVLGMVGALIIFVLDVLYDVSVGSLINRRETK
jgi:hypothetical protein